MITLGWHSWCSSWRMQMKFTGGEDGLQGIPRGKLFGLST
jgi:ABC-type branched-subunit amino acid transport system permease subunit